MMIRPHAVVLVGTVWFSAAARNAAACAQDPPTKDTSTTPAPVAPLPTLRRDLTKLRGIELRYPRDKDTVVASVDDTDITLDAVIRHIGERHATGFVDFLATPAGNLYFQQRIPADWVRHYADIVALRAAARYHEIGADVIEAKLKKADETPMSQGAHI